MIRLSRWLDRIGRRLAATPAIGIGLAVALLAISLMLAVHNEGLARAEKTRDAEIQARILAASLAGPLAFDDAAGTREYVEALSRRPDVLVIGAYGDDGRVRASFTRRGRPLPATARIGPPIEAAGELSVTAPVTQSGTRLGSVLLTVATESWWARATRYAGIAIVVVLASLLVAALAIFYAQASAAHRQLTEEIEHRREAEEALRQAQKMEAMGQLTGGVAHDFNNMLMVASSGLDLLDRTDDPAKRARLNDGIRQAIERGAKLTQQLLTFARRSPLTPEVLDIGARIRALQSLLERSLREDIAVDLAIPAGVWPIEVDASQLDVAVLNIAINARDAMPNGGSLRISAANLPGEGDRADMVGLSIRDSGTGIAPELMQKVFEPFFTTKGVGSGTGLGLSQVYGFARSSDGEVRIESQLGDGTTVTLLFPRSSKPLPHRIYRAADQGTADGSRRILIVEDDDHVAELVGQMLQELGYQSVRAQQATEGLDLIGSSGPFDLVLSDMIMPGRMNGLDLAQELGRRHRGLPVILMTGFSEAAASAAAEGIPLLVKPYTIDALGDALRKALR
jgi:signal transduction histidine kinase